MQGSLAQTLLAVAAGVTVIWAGLYTYFVQRNMRVPTLLLYFVYAGLVITGIFYDRQIVWMSLLVVLVLVAYMRFQDIRLLGGPKR